MNRERFNEIIAELLKLNETVETTTLLKELKDGFNEPVSEDAKVDNSKELEDMTKKYKDLEQLYITTFKNELNNTIEKKTPIKSELNVEVPEETETFDNIFINE